MPIEIFNADGAPNLGALPQQDNTSDARAHLLLVNAWFRENPWPEPYGVTQHRLHLGDAGELGWIDDKSVHLVVCSPPYWNLKKYEERDGQMGHIDDYEEFLDRLDAVWSECLRVLVPGGRVCCVVGDVCLSRKQAGRHHVVPLHSDIQTRVRRLRCGKAGFDTVQGIFWHKIANVKMEATGNGSAFLGKPNQPNSIIKNDVEYILFFRKTGGYRSVDPLKKALSMISTEEHGRWFRSAWSDVPGASTQTGHPAPYPPRLAERLIKMFSFAGDTVLDPFVGSGSTSTAAMRTGRNSIGNELEPIYLNQAITKLRAEAAAPRHAPLTTPMLVGPALEELAVEAVEAVEAPGLGLPV